MIRFDHVTVCYEGASAPTLRDVNLQLNDGTLVLVSGRTGAGKSTLLRMINGLVPHFTGGHVSGHVTVDGRDTRHYPPRELADVVGVVGQDPLAGFVTDTVEEELAYGMEQLAVPPSTMRKRVEETLDLLGIADLRNRWLRTLSGGQQQRVAIGSVLTTHPRVLVLDEPTSALDPTAAEEVLATITRLVHDLGVTVVVAEHRMERVIAYADDVVHCPGDGVVIHGPPEQVLATSDVAPPVVQLGRLAGWSPLPLSVRAARRQAGPLRAQLAEHTPPPRPGAHGPAVLDANGITVRYGDLVAVRDVDIALHPGQVTALMGRNGSGKSTLLWALQGSGPRHGGSLTIDGVDPTTAKRDDPRRHAGPRTHVGMVPQNAADLLYLNSVDAECAAADADAEPGSARALLDRFAPGIAGAAHPREVSEGQRLALVLAIQMVTTPPVLFLDEPTRGLDYHAKRQFTTVIGELAAAGAVVVVATHDVEFVAEAASRVLVMAEGEIVADGATAEVISASPAFAPQVAKVVDTGGWLTVSDVAAALAGAAT